MSGFWDCSLALLAVFRQAHLIGVPLDAAAGLMRPCPWGSCSLALLSTGQGPSSSSVFATFSWGVSASASGPRRGFLPPAASCACGCSPYFWLPIVISRCISFSGGSCPLSTLRSCRHFPLGRAFTVPCSRVPWLTYASLPY